MVAQGRRPGKGSTESKSPEGATSQLSSDWIAPSGLPSWLILLPRVLPWADLFRPFRPWLPLKPET